MARLRSLVQPGDLDLVKLGVVNGGWTIPASAIQEGKVAVCIGAGENISFDVELNKKGMRVYTADPTPRAKNHVARVLDMASGGPPVTMNQSDTTYDLDGFESS